MLKDIFYTTKYDSKILIKNEKPYSVFEIKELIKTKCEEIKNKNKNVVICEDDNFSFIINFFASVFTKKTIYLIDTKQKLQNLDFEYEILDSKIENTKSNFEFNKIDINNPCINFCTSGTTSAPKIFKKSLFNLIQEAYDIKNELNLEENNLEVITTTILQHLFSLTFFLMFSLANIDKNYIINTNKVLYPDCINIKNSILVSTPIFLETIKKYEVKINENPKYIISAGSKLNDDIFSYLEKFSNVIEIYGSTETGVIAHKTKSGGKMTLFKNVKVEITDNKTTVQSDYFPENKIEINDEIELNGRNVEFKQRRDKILKIYDKRINAQEIEERLNKNDFIEKSYCFKYKDKLATITALSNKGKKYLTENGTVKLKASLKNYLKNYFQIIPQKWRFIDSLPVNTRGKTDKNVIESFFSINFSMPIILDKQMSQNSIVYKLFFYKNSNYFKGHFPDFPIVPGVVQLYMASFLGKIYFMEDLVAGQIKKIKFSNLIKPDSIIKLKLEKNENNVKFEYFDENNIYSSGVLPARNIFEYAQSEIEK